MHSVITEKELVFFSLCQNQKLVQKNDVGFKCLYQLISFSLAVGSSTAFGRRVAPLNQATLSHRNSFNKTASEVPEYLKIVPTAAK